MTTLRDISRRSGYSVTTVSRALNGFDDVTEATRLRIEAVAREMNYRPNQVARKLVAGRSGMVALVLPEPPAPFEQGHFFHIVAGASREFSGRDMDFVLHVGTGGEVLPTYERLINRGTLDGFIVTAPEVGDPRIALLLERGVPFVVHGRDPGQGGYPFVDGDNAGVSRMGVDLLAGLGHRRIGLLNGPERATYARARRAGYEAALAAHGIAPEPGLVRHGDTSPDYGRREGPGLVAAGATAVLCCNSLTAAGLLAALGEAGLRVPEDVAVVSHDDLLPQVDTARTEPPLTVTRLPLVDAAAPLAELLVRRIAGEPVESLQRVLGAELVLRGSHA